MMTLLPHSQRLAYVDGKPATSGVLKSIPEDFIVEEILGFEPSGEGEHLFIFVEAKDYNTEFLLSHIARCLKVPNKHVVYSGLKDRYAVSRQWFAVHLPGKEPVDTQVIENEHVRVLKVGRNLKKLRRGAHRGNQFTLRLRAVSGDRDDIERRCLKIASEGFPNYFGPQRFGHGENNITQALACVESKRAPKKRFQRSMTFSTLRSLLFNLQLSHRVEEGSWQHYCAGDVMALSGTESFFVPEVLDDELKQRLEQGDVAVGGVLWGEGELPLTGLARESLLNVLNPFEGVKAFLENQRLALSIRPLSVRPQNFSFQWLDDDIELSFQLSKGVFATSLLRGIIATDQVAPKQG